jgi:hypothetical protein
MPTPPKQRTTQEFTKALGGDIIPESQNADAEAGFGGQAKSCWRAFPPSPENSPGLPAGPDNPSIMAGTLPAQWLPGGGRTGVGAATVPIATPAPIRHQLWTACSSLLAGRSRLRQA